MHALAETRVPSTTTLSPEQRERLRREGRIARAVEAAQRHSDGAHATRRSAASAASRTPALRSNAGS